MRQRESAPPDSHLAQHPPRPQLAAPVAPEQLDARPARPRHHVPCPPPPPLRNDNVCATWRSRVLAGDKDEGAWPA